MTVNSKIARLLAGRGGNFILPFFWQHGEDEATLRKYMDVIHRANIGAVCVESRPHPDYCGPGWWRDMDIILDEARKRNMKVWILDDSHFPTGFANGAMKGQPDELRRRSITFRRIPLREGETLSLSAGELRQAGLWKPGEMEKRFGLNITETENRGDDRLLGIAAVRTDDRGTDGKDSADTGSAAGFVDLLPFVTEDGIRWKPDRGNWQIHILNITQNRGPHRDYINMMDRRSVQVLIDAVYEPHYRHYGADFGKTIAGFFSDEPELGNGHLYEKDNQFGCYDDQDYPWSTELEDMLKERLGTEWPNALAYLWDNDAKPEDKARIRYAYMDCVTRLVEKDFSWQIGDWCRSHGVKYIGHLIEDNNQHARTGSSLGHYFRGLSGEDWAGIDDIGGQIIPQGEDLKLQGFAAERDGEFFHYMLGKLASSAAAIEPIKQGNSMCEVFGAYGWNEGVRLEKYLIDHLMVRGINHFVPHAFSPKAYPDPDCPPHFYAHGNNPQYRHFGALMAYTNRVCELISGGRHIAPAAVLYHGEGEWMGRAAYSQEAGRRFADAQIEYDYIPADVFEETGKFKTCIADGALTVNDQVYRLVVIPETEYLSRAAAEGIRRMIKAGVAAVYVNTAPKGIGNTLPSALSDGEAGQDTEELWSELSRLPVVPIDDLTGFAERCGVREIRIEPADNRIRFLHYVQTDKSSVFLFVNEGAAAWKGSITIPKTESSADVAYLYDAWENRLYAADIRNGSLRLTIEPLKSRILITDRSGKSADGADSAESSENVRLYPETAVQTGSLEGFEEFSFDGKWKRRYTRSIHYPEFGPEKEVILPDRLAEEEPLFSGIVRYENTVSIPDKGEPAAEYLLVAEKAEEAIEVFVNGKSLGIRIAPPFRYDLTGTLLPGKNTVVIEVATTLEREASQFPNPFGINAEPTCGTGITGTVKLYTKSERKV